MTNVVSFHCTCDYLVRRAARHRRAGRYDEAMALLWKARNQFGYSDEVLIEIARIYDEIDCQEEAARTYLRLVRIGGKYRAQALFQLGVYSMQCGDVQRAASYVDLLYQMKKRSAFGMISDEALEALKLQVRREIRSSFSLSSRKRARALEKHAAACLQAGKAVAAQRAIEHALRFYPTARRYTMLACCQLIRMKFADAAVSAETAHEMSPGNIQTLCVLADAYLGCDDVNRARSTIYLAALRARKIDDLLSVAVECAKLGEDAWTLSLTGRILKIMPFHTRAMMLRACAHINRQAYRPAKQLLARLCGLLPENTICESYFRCLSAGEPIGERLSLGLDVTREEGIRRGAELVSRLCTDPADIDNDQEVCLRICRLSDWAFHSPMAGSTTKTIALLLLSSLNSGEAKNTLLDLLMDPAISDTLKLHTLQVLTAKEGFYPYEVDMGGKLVRLAASGITQNPVGFAHANTKIVQRIVDALPVKDANTSETLLKAFLSYLSAYGHPDRRHENACSAALEAWYLKRQGYPTSESSIAARYGVSVRNMRVHLRRFESCMQKQE